MAQKPLELILARNFLTSLSTPAFLVDESGALVFYNEAAGALLGISFEESGRMPAAEWSHSQRGREIRDGGSDQEKEGYRRTDARTAAAL